MARIIVVTEKDIAVDDWGMVKKRISRSNSPPVFKQGEVWWCRIGENVGIEINGKNAEFTRPVLIMKKHSKYGFMGVPLTTQAHAQNPWWYEAFELRGKISYVALAQAKTMSALRLKSRVGSISDPVLQHIKKRFRALYR